MANGGAYFYNLSDQQLVINVNGFNGDDVSGLGSSPYKPNASNNSPYSRYNTSQPQSGQFGSANTLAYLVGGGAGNKVSVTINVDFNRYPEDDDLIVYLFNSAVIVMSPSDSVPYLGNNGSTINVGPGSANQVG
jgi:hypothetical protein